MVGLSDLLNIGFMRETERLLHESRRLEKSYYSATDAGVVMPEA